MSTTPQANSSFNCPHCTQALCLTNLSDGQSISCTQCGMKSMPSFGKQIIYDGKAKLTLILGLVSLVFGFITGIPATIIGLRALKRIRRGEASIKGAQFARVGVALGATTTLATFLMFATVIIVIVVGFNSFSVTQSKVAPIRYNDLWCAAFLPEPPAGVAPRTSVTAMNVMRLVRMRDAEDNGQSNVEINLAQFRKGLLVISNEVLAIQLQEQSKREVKIDKTEKIYLKNRHGSFVLNRIDGTQNHSNGRRMKAFYANVPVKNQSIIVELVVYQSNFQSNNVVMGVDGRPLTTENAEPEFPLTDGEVIEYFKAIGARQPG